jgi:hypothetical protein
MSTGALVVGVVKGDLEMNSALKSMPFLDSVNLVKIRYLIMSSGNDHPIQELKDLVNELEAIIMLAEDGDPFEEELEGQSGTINTILETHRG